MSLARPEKKRGRIKKRGHICPAFYISHNISAPLLQCHPRKIPLNRFHAERGSKKPLQNSFPENQIRPCDAIPARTALANYDYILTTVQDNHFRLSLFDGSLPVYICRPCAYEPSRKTYVRFVRSSSCKKHLKVQKCNTETFEKPNSFSFLAPSVWNSLSFDSRISSTLPFFKSRL